MRKFFALSLIIITSVLHAQNSQPLTCSLTITGDTCEASNGNVLTANFSGARVLDTIKWYSNGVMQNVRARGTFKDTATWFAGGSQGSGDNQFNYPSDLFVDNNGYIYVTDYFNSRVQKWATGGTKGKTVAGGNGEGSNLNQLRGPEGIFVDSLGNIYIADLQNRRIVRWGPNSTSGVLVAGGNYTVDGAYLYPFDVWIKGNTMFIADGGVTGGRIIKWNIGDTTGTVIPGSNIPGSFYLHSVCVDKSGNVYGSYYIGVYKFVPGSTSGILVAGGNGVGSNSNQLNDNHGLFIDASDNLYIAERGGQRVSKWAPNSSYGVTIAGDEGAGSSLYQFHFANSAAVFIGNNGYLYVLDDFNERISLFTPQSANSIKKVWRTKPANPIIVRNINADAVSKASCNVTSNNLKMIAPTKITNAISGPSYLPCANARFYSINTEPYALSYQWSNPAGSDILSGQGTTKIKLQSNSLTTGTLSVSALNTCNVYGAPATLEISSTPRKSSVSGPSSVSLNQPYVYTATPTLGVTNFAWSVTPGAVINSGQGTSSVSITFQSGDIWFVSEVSNSPCGSADEARMIVLLSSNLLNTTKKALSENSDINVYPNPAQDILYLSVQNNSSSKITVSISDISGRNMNAKDYYSAPGNFKIKLDISGYAPGLYLINVKTDHGNEILKIVKIDP